MRRELVSLQEHVEVWGVHADAWMSPQRKKGSNIFLRWKTLAEFFSWFPQFFENWLQWQGATSEKHATRRETQIVTWESATPAKPVTWNATWYVTREKTSWARRSLDVWWMQRGVRERNATSVETWRHAPERDVWREYLYGDEVRGVLPPWRRYHGDGVAHSDVDLATTLHGNGVRAAARPSNLREMWETASGGCTQPTLTPHQHKFSTPTGSLSAGVPHLVPAPLQLRAGPSRLNLQRTWSASINVWGVWRHLPATPVEFHIPRHTQQQVKVTEWWEWDSVQDTHQCTLADPEGTTQLAHWSLHPKQHFMNFHFSHTPPPPHTQTPVC